MLKNIQVPLNYSPADLLLTKDNRLNVYFEFEGNFDSCSVLFKYDDKYEFFIDTLYSNSSLRPFYSKVETLSNGNIIIAGQCDSVVFDPFDILFAYGVFMYDSDFNYINHHVLTNFYEDTISQTAWLETVKVNEAGEIFILSNYYFDALPFDGKATKGYVAKLDHELNLIWEDYFGGDKFYSLMVVEPTDDGGVIICSHSNELTDTTSKTYSWFRKYDENGYVGVNENSLITPGLCIYPNPASNRIIVEADEKISNISIFDISGRKILSINPNETVASIDVDNKQSGVYVIQLRVNNIITNKKLIIQ